MAIFEPLSYQRRALVEQLTDSERDSDTTSTPRRVELDYHFPNKATSIIGMRRAGKTTFMRQIRRSRISDGHRTELSPFISFEDERLNGVKTTDLSFLVDEHLRLYPRELNEKVTWYFDEIQLVEGWERFVRRLLDASNTDVFLTGSSSTMLSQEIASSLRGRAWTIPIHPFGFDESLRHSRDFDLSKIDSLSREDRLDIERRFLNWLKTGGFPEIQGLDDRLQIRVLRDYVDVTVLRDVIERHNVSNVQALLWMVRQLLGNPAAMFSIEKFHNTCRSSGIAVSKDTLHQMLSWLHDCFLVRVIGLDTTSYRRKMVNPRKAYPIDAGLIQVFDRTGRANIGHALETAILIELERRFMEVGYCRTSRNFEVDFVARSLSGEVDLIQVCADLTNAETLIREVRALEDAENVYPEARKLILTLRQDTFPLDIPQGIEIMTAWEWILQRDR